MAEDTSQLSLIEIRGTGLSWPHLLTTSAMEAVAQDGGGVILFTGHRSLAAFGHYLLVWRLLEQESVIFVDGANVFDLPLITRLVREMKKDPRRLLERIHLSRAFTVHQLEAVLTVRLEQALTRYGSRLCLISGLLDTFSDEEVPMWEAIRILQRVMARLRSLADHGHRMIVLAPEPLRNI